VLWVLVAVAAVAVVVIALVAVGRVTFSLAEQTRQSSYDLDEAVNFVADGLPEDATAELSYDDVRTVLELHLDYLEARGVAFEVDPVPSYLRAFHEGVAAEAGPASDGPDAPVDAVGVVDQVGDPVAPAGGEAITGGEATSGPVVADDDDALPYILGRLSDAGRQLDDVHVVEVLVAERRYLEAIGAIGTPVPEPDDPTAGAPSSG
jgi:hypothetical protein